MKALITQREQFDHHGVAIDVLESSYTSYFESLGMELIQLSNFTSSLDKILLSNKFEIIILTGGGSIPSKFYQNGNDESPQVNRDRLEWLLMEYAVKNGIPILGICRGMQYMNAFLGGKIIKLDNLEEKRPIGKEHLISLGNGNELYVNNYHNDGINIENLAKGFKVLGVDRKNMIVEALYSRGLKWLGLQWHPERLMKDKLSKKKCDKLIYEFIETGGFIDEGYYFSSWTGN